MGGRKGEIEGSGFRLRLTAQTPRAMAAAAAHGSASVRRLSTSQAAHRPAARHRRWLRGHGCGYARLCHVADELSAGGRRRPAAAGSFCCPADAAAPPHALVWPYLSFAVDAELRRMLSQTLRRVARPSSRIVVDDIINVNQSAALHRMESQRAIRILEAYSFQKNSKHNPCPLNPKRRILPCDTRGFAVVEYAVRRAT